MISLAAVRSTTSPEKSVTLMADSHVDFASRLSSARASRGGPRAELAPAPATTSTTTPPPPTVRPKPKAVVAPTVAKPAPKPAAAAAPAPKQPAPAASSAPAPAPASERPMPPRGGSTHAEEGKASWYNAKYHESNPWICAHKTIARGMVLTVTNVKTGAQITCEVGDRGPYVEGRILDLSKHAFSHLASPSAGLVNVRITWG